LRKQHNRSKRGTALKALAAARARVYDARRKIATVAAGALVMVMGYGVVFGHNGLTAFAHKREEARTLQKQMQQLQTENGRMREHVDQLQNDPVAIEHQAREELHYTRAGEVIYTLPATPNNNGTAQAGTR
jgi:cell division protein FtsB